MAGPTMTFKPEEVRQSHPWELASKQALRSLKEQKLAMRRWMKRFKKEFMPRFIATYNTEAKRLGLPPAHPKWFEYILTASGAAGGPKSFYTKHRAKLQHRMFPGDPVKAKRAYDLFLKEMDKLPLVRTSPMTGTLAHETGHVQTFYTDPDVVIKARRPRSIMTGKAKAKPLMETAVSEAVGSYRGYQLAWKTWRAWGIPRKAWVAWAGFPTYAAKMKPAQIKDLLTRLKKLDARMPGLSDMAKKALYNYNDYIYPVLYNVPGKDWTAAEKRALKKWVRARGGKYRSTMPKSRRRRIRHLKRQPYVERKTPAPMRAPGAAVASKWPPLSKRAMGVPLSKRAGELIEFPSKLIREPEEKQEPGQILSPGFSSKADRWHLVYSMSMPVGWYDRKHQAERAVRHLIDDFARGNEGSLVWQSMEAAAATEPVFDEFADEHDLWDVYEFILSVLVRNSRGKELRRRLAEQTVKIHEVPRGFLRQNLRPMSGPPQGDAHSLSEELESGGRLENKDLYETRRIADLVSQFLLKAVRHRLNKLSWRRWPPPLSKWAGEVIQFPTGKPIEPESESGQNDEGEDERGQVLHLRRWFLLHFGSDLIRWYPSKDKAQHALNEVKEEFVRGGTESQGLIDDAVMSDIMRATLAHLERAGLLRETEVLTPDELFDLDIYNNPVHAILADESYALIEDPEHDETRARMADAGLGIADAPPKFMPPEKAVGEGLPPYPPVYELDELPPEVSAKVWPRERAVSAMADRIAKDLADRVVRRHKRER